MKQVIFGAENVEISELTMYTKPLFKIFAVEISIKMQ